MWGGDVSSRWRGSAAVALQSGSDGRRESADSTRAAELIRELLELLGEDASRPGLRETPDRAYRALRWLTGGYDLSAEDAIGTGMFEEAHGSMVLVRDIEFYSLCEHHLLPFFGRVHVAYIPDGFTVGLSKIARVVETFARRLQMQERLTEQIADGLATTLRPRGVGVVVEARHMCMLMRGVQKERSCTLTYALKGQFADCSVTRAEFLELARNHDS